MQARWRRRGISRSAYWAETSFHILLTTTWLARAKCHKTSHPPCSRPDVGCISSSCQARDDWRHYTTQPTHRLGSRPLAVIGRWRSLSPSVDPFVSRCCFLADKTKTINEVCGECTSREDHWLCWLKIRGLKVYQATESLFSGPSCTSPSSSLTKHQAWQSGRQIQFRINSRKRSELSRTPDEAIGLSK